MRCLMVRLVLGAVVSLVMTFCPAVSSAGEADSGQGQTPVAAPQPPAEARQPGEQESAAEAGQAYRLRYRFKPGQIVRYEVSHEMTLETRYAQTAETVYNKSTAEKHYRVCSVQDGSAVLELVLDRVKMTARFGDAEPVHFDSESSEPPPAQFQQINERIGQPQARAKFDETGELLSLSPLKSDSAEQSSEAKPGKPRQNFLVVFPEKPVRLGDSWQDEYQVKVTVTKQLRQKITLHRNYRLQSVEDGIATIRLKTAVHKSIDNPRVRAQLIQRMPSGTLRFDLQRGLIVSRKLTIDKTEVGVFGPKSFMRAQSTRTERLLRQAIAEEPTNSAQGERR